MRYVSREYLICERFLQRARAELSRLGYARWQLMKLELCDSEMHKLDNVKEQYDRLKKRYDRARDYHRHSRGRLRRQYYSWLETANRPPDPGEGIEAKAAALANIVVPEHLEAGRAEVLATLAECNETRRAEKAEADEYCRVHNELCDIIKNAKIVADECHRLAMRVLKSERTALSRARFDLFEKKPK